MNEFLGLDNLMAFFGITSNPAFAQYYNDILSVNENQNLDIRGCRWGKLQTVFTYEMYEKYNDVEVMATFVDLDSDPLPMGGRTKTKKMTGSIPRHKALVTLNEQDYREKLSTLYQVQNTAALMGENVGDAIRNDLEEYMFTQLSAIPAAHKNTLNFMVGQLKSRLDFTLTEQNNPQGIQGITFPSHVPEGNRLENMFWTVDADGNCTYKENEDPVKYLKKLVKSIKNNKVLSLRYSDVTIEMSEKTFDDLMEHPAWAMHVAYTLQPQFYLVAKNDKNALAYGNKVLADMDDAAKMDIFKRIVGASELLLNKAVVSAERIVKEDGVSPYLERPIMDAFDYGKILVRPSGDFIEIIPVVPMRPDSSAISATMYGKRGIVEYWYDKREKVQTWRSELTCIPVFINPSKVYNVAIATKVEDTTPKYTVTFVFSDNSVQTVEYAAGDTIAYPANTDGYKWPDDKKTTMEESNYVVTEVTA